MLFKLKFKHTSQSRSLQPCASCAERAVGEGTQPAAPSKRVSGRNQPQSAQQRSGREPQAVACTEGRRGLHVLLLTAAVAAVMPAAYERRRTMRLA